MRLLDYVNKRANNQKGFTLVLVLMILLVVSVIGMSLLTVTASNFKFSANERDFQSVYYIAEAGLNYELNDLEGEVVDIYDNSDTAAAFFSQLESHFSSPTLLNSFQETFGKNPEARVTVTLIENISENERKYAITSEGTIGNRIRSAETEIVFQWISKAGT
ncbi:MAG TPA: hypothetical protein DHM90_08930, partial [Clostridiaceae bacterium]|nr:hypothetical protein [Clostridiaceae bacterium]